MLNCASQKEEDNVLVISNFIPPNFAILIPNTHDSSVHFTAFFRRGEGTKHLYPLWRGF